MLHLRVFGPAGSVAELGARLEGEGIARQIVLAPALRPDHVLLTAEVGPESADSVMEAVRHSGVPADGFALARLEEIGQFAAGATGTSLIWTDVLGQASRNARPVARFLVLMAVAGVIAAFGVIEASSTLIVGAMAVSPDTQPVAATCVGIVSRRGLLARRAFLTLVVGLATTCLAAAALTVMLNLFDLLPAGFVVGEAALKGLTTVNSATIGVALAAGVAGMLAFETRASSAVGVAISVTTIPAAAYLGVALGVSEGDKVPGTIAVLVVNVALLLVSGSATLAVQGWLARRRRGRPRERCPAAYSSLGTIMSSWTSAPERSSLNTTYASGGPPNHDAFSPSPT